MRAAFVQGDLQPLADGFLAHWLMRAEGDQHVELGRSLADGLMQSLEEKPNRSRACAVRHDQQHAFASEARFRAGPANRFGNLSRADQPIGRRQRQD